MSGKRGSLTLFNWEKSILSPSLDKCNNVSSRKSVSTVSSEISLSPCRSQSGESEISDLTQRIRISLMNEVKPACERVNLPEVEPKRFLRPIRRNSEPGNIEQNERATSAPRLSYWTRNAEEAKELSPKKVSFAKRKQAFTYLQNLAMDIRQDEEVIFGEEQPFDYLKEIEDFQNEYKKCIKSQHKPTMSAKMSKVSKFETPLVRVKLANRMRKMSCITTTAATSVVPTVSNEVITGLSSILEHLESPKSMKSSKKGKASKRRKSLKKKSGRRTSLPQKASGISEVCWMDIPVDRLRSIVDSLSNI